MKRIIVVGFFLLQFAGSIISQDKYSSVALKFYLDDEIQKLDSSLCINFLVSDSLLTVYPTRGEIKIPYFPCGKFAQMSVTYNDFSVSIPRVSIKEYLTYKEKVSWEMGFDSRPFDRKYVKEFPVYENTENVFYWNIVFDEIEDLLVIPLDGCPEIDFPIFEENMDY
jgi:hypothetical protein